MVGASPQVCYLHPLLSLGAEVRALEKRIKFLETQIRKVHRQNCELESRLNVIEAMLGKTKCVNFVLKENG